MAIRLSKPSKMPCHSWSLPAVDTCPGAKQKGGELVAACKGCYATAGRYHCPNVKEPREENKIDWHRDDWVPDMIQELDTHRYFRWFDSGDVYRVELAEKILEVMASTPWVKHWLPTRSHKSPKINAVLEKMEALPNVMVRRSSDGIFGEHDERHGSTIIPDPESATESMTVCGAYSRDGKCGPCRACWDKGIDLIAYPAHGAKMHKVIRIAVSA